MEEQHHLVYEVFVELSYIHIYTALIKLITWRMLYSRLKLAYGAKFTNFTMLMVSNGYFPMLPEILRAWGIFPFGALVVKSIFKLLLSNLQGKL